MKYKIEKLIMSLIFIFVHSSIHALSPAQIAQKTALFNEHIATLTDLNKNYEGFSQEARTTIKNAQQVINELRRSTDTESLQIQLDEILLNRDNYYTSRVTQNVKDIIYALGALNKTGNHMLGWSETEDPFFQQVHDNVLKDFYSILVQHYPTGNKNTPTRSGINLTLPASYKDLSWMPRLTTQQPSQQTTGGVLYWLNQSHEQFLNFANIFGKDIDNPKAFFTQKDDQADIIKTLINNIYDVLSQIYWSESDKNVFSLSKGKVLIIPDEQKYMLDKSLKNVGGILYHLNKDLAHYKEIMKFAGETNNTVLNISLAMDQMNNDIEQINKNYTLQLAPPFTDEYATQKTFIDVVFSMHDQMYNKWANPLMEFTKSIRKNTNPKNSKEIIENIQQWAFTQCDKAKGNTLEELLVDIKTKATETEARSWMSDLQTSAAQLTGISQEHVGSTTNQIIQNAIIKTLVPIKDAIISLASHSENTKQGFNAWINDHNQSLAAPFYSNNTQQTIIKTLTEITQHIEKVGTQIPQLKFSAIQ